MMNTATEQELEWARAIRQAAQNDPSIVAAQDISDVEFLHHAMVAKDQVHKALTRLRRMQILKQRS